MLKKSPGLQFDGSECLICSFSHNQMLIIASRVNQQMTYKMVRKKGLIADNGCNTGAQFTTE